MFVPIRFFFHYIKITNTPLRIFLYHAINTNNASQEECCMLDSKSKKNVLNVGMIYCTAWKWKKQRCYICLVYTQFLFEIIHKFHVYNLPFDKRKFERSHKPILCTHMMGFLLSNVINQKASYILDRMCEK